MVVQQKRKQKLKQKQRQNQNQRVNQIVKIYLAERKKARKGRGRQMRPVVPSKNRPTYFQQPIFMNTYSQSQPQLASKNLTKEDVENLILNFRNVRPNVRPIITPTPTKSKSQSPVSSLQEFETTEASSQIPDYVDPNMARMLREQRSMVSGYKADVSNVSTKDEPSSQTDTDESTRRPQSSQSSQLSQPSQTPLTPLTPQTQTPQLPTYLDLTRITPVSERIINTPSSVRTSLTDTTSSGTEEGSLGAVLPAEMLGLENPSFPSPSSEGTMSSAIRRGLANAILDEAKEQPSITSDETSSRLSFAPSTNREPPPIITDEPRTRDAETQIIRPTPMRDASTSPTRISRARLVADELSNIIGL